MSAHNMTKNILTTVVHYMYIYNVEIYVRAYGY